MPRILGFDGERVKSSEVRPFFVFVFTNSYVSLPFSHTLDKPEKLYNAEFGQANAEF